MKRLHKLGLGLGAGAVLAAVVMAYLDPHFMVAVANQIWACF
jgi:hypothetical protein